MTGDEFDRYLSEQPTSDSEPQEESPITPDLVNSVLLAVHNALVKALDDNNSLVITIIRNRADGPVVWSATVRGVTVMCDTFEQFMDTISRIN